VKRVRAKCGATGVDIGSGYCLIVSAQDNDIFVDKIDLAPTVEPHPTLPIPTEQEYSGARAVMRYFRIKEEEENPPVMVEPPPYDDLGEPQMLDYR
jgi:hypothetical protein